MFSDLAREQFAGGLFFTKGAGELAQAQVQIFDGAITIAQAGVEFAFAQREHVGADLEVLLKLVA
jgi:hypothetical protein